MHSFRRTIDRYKLNSLLVFFRYTGILRLGNWIMHTANKKSNYAKPELENDLKNELQRYYQRDIEQLENLTKRDLTNWKTAEADI
jgi:transcriptional regulator of aromatic amino acid metabolism